jgi:hypothetical protein
LSLNFAAKRAARCRKRISGQNITVKHRPVDPRIHSFLEENHFIIIAAKHGPTLRPNCTRHIARRNRIPLSFPVTVRGLQTDRHLKIGRVPFSIKPGRATQRITAKKAYEWYGACLLLPECSRPLPVRCCNRNLVRYDEGSEV